MRIMKFLYLTIITMVYTCILHVSSEDLMKRTRVKRTWFGKHTDIKDEPYVVALEIINDYSSQHCSGVIVHPKWIMTTASCIIGKPTTLIIRYGTNDRLDPESPSIRIDLPEDPEEIEKIIVVNPLFAQQIDFLRHDMALIKLKEPLNLSDTVGVIKVESNPWPINEKGYPEEIGCRVLGFGVHNESHSQLHMSKFIMQHGRTCECFRSTPFGLCSKITTENNRDIACFGDWGGPLICSDALVGIFSNLARCSESSGPVECGEIGLINGYTYVQPFIPWITKFVDLELTQSTDSKSPCERELDLIKVQLETLNFEKEQLIRERDENWGGKTHESLVRVAEIIRHELEKHGSEMDQNGYGPYEKNNRQNESLWQLKEKLWKLEKRQWLDDELEYLKLLNRSMKGDDFIKIKENNFQKKKMKIEQETESLINVKQQLIDIKNELLKKQEEFDKRDQERNHEDVIRRMEEDPDSEHSGQNVKTISQILMFALVIKVLC